MRRTTVLIAGIAAATITATAGGIALADQDDPRPPTAGAHETDDHDDGRNPANTKVSADQARSIALKAVPGGKVTEIELDREDHALVWEVELTTGDGERELHVDSQTGAIVKNRLDTDHD